MLENRGKQIEIRSKIIEDLIVLINELQPDNREVILTIDANEQFESGKGDVVKLMSMTKIVDPIECTHGLQNIPNTYQRGSKRIDFIFNFPKTYKYIRACGITTFSQVSPSNHRGIFINVDLISLLQNKVQTNIDLLSRLLRSNDIKQVTKYKQTLQAYMKQHGIIQQSDKINGLMKTNKPTINDMPKIDALDKLITI